MSNIILTKSNKIELIDYIDDDNLEEKAPIPIMNCNNCHTEHLANKIEYCPYHNECFTFKHKNCNQCNFCILFRNRDNNQDSNTCNYCLNIDDNLKINIPKNYYLEDEDISFSIPLIKCKKCHKEHYKKYKYYCSIEEKCFEDNHTYCPIDSRCTTDNEFHCSECNKCHNVNEIEYCNDCDDCYEYEHKCCAMCSKCIENNNEETVVCDDCMIKITKTSSNYICSNCGNKHINMYKYNYCEFCTICYKEPNKCMINHYDELCIVCDTIHENSTEYCSKSNKINIDINK